MNTVKTILFVENDPVALQMYSNRLEREGFHIDSAQDGLEALKRISQFTPDLVVLDMMLPRLSGEDVLKFIRADPRLKTLPVAIFSNAPVTQLAPDLTLAGPTRKLLKSDCTFPMLLQTIQDLLTAASNGNPEVVSSPDHLAVSQQTGSGQPAPAAGIPGEPAAGCAQFLADTLAEMPKIREHCFAYIKAPASPASLQHLPSLCQRVHLLSSDAVKAGCARVAMLTNAFDALLSEIMVKPSWVTPSVLQTTAQAVDCLGLLLKGDEAALAKPMPQAKVLAVDDDAVCNHVMITTLKRAGFDAKSVDDPLAALEMLENSSYHLVLLDISMPGMTGFELCEKLRRFPHCKTVPVIFITGHNNFDNRKQSVLSGGHDFIAKPVSPTELVLKATIHLLKAPAQGVAASQSMADPGTTAVSKTRSPPATPAYTTPPAGREAQPELPSEPPTATESWGMAPEQELTTVRTAVATEPTPDLLSGTRVAPSTSHDSASPESNEASSVSSLAAAASVTETGTTSASEVTASSNSAVDSATYTGVPADGPSAGHLKLEDAPACEPDEQFDRIAVIVARIMFGEDNPAERNLRLVRIALEHHNVREILSRPAAAQDQSRTPRA